MQNTIYLLREVCKEHMPTLMQQKSMWIIGLAIVAGALFSPLGQLKPILPFLLMMLMYLSTLDIAWERVLTYGKHFKENSEILGIIYLGSSLAVLGLSPLIISYLSKEMYIGLLIATIAPSGISIIVLAKLFDGLADEALVITVLSNILSPIVIPLLFLLYLGETVQLPFVSMMFSIAQLVIIPLLLVTVSKKIHLDTLILPWSKPISLVLLFLVIGSIISQVTPVILTNISQTIVLSAVIACLIGIEIFFGYLLGSNRQEKITFMIAGSYKNYALATVIALTFFSVDVALPASLYAVVNNIMLYVISIIKT